MRAQNAERRLLIRIMSLEVCRVQRRRAPPRSYFPGLCCLRMQAATSSIRFLTCSVSGLDPFPPLLLARPQRSLQEQQDKPTMLVRPTEGPKTLGSKSEVQNGEYSGHVWS
ncbi:hypothetical protein Mapa_001871 [Marchantia paleacea]|nr:hypothetical protein Mapa_001871 [Marchantia paleacea]